MNVSCGRQHCKCGFTLTELTESRTKTNDNTAILQIGIGEKKKIQSYFLVSYERTKEKKTNNSEWERDKKW